MAGLDPATLFWLPLPSANWRRDLETALANDATGRLLRGFCSQQLNISQLRTVASTLAKARENGAELSALRQVRLGLIGTGTLDFLADAIPGTAPRFGLQVSVAPIEYDAIAQASYGGLDFGAPLDLLAIVPDLRSFVRPAALLDEAGHRQAVDAGIGMLERIVAATRGQSGCEIVLTTIPLDPELLVGSADRAVWGSDWRFVGDLNARIVELAERAGLALWDLEALAATVGARAWRDPISLHAAKSPFAIGLAPLVADRLCALIAAVVGKSRRALVLDLDNTCWGGVIGDDGLDGIVLGQGDTVGEAFLALQRYALALRRRGIVLCVCSKNDDAVARAPFRDHPDMLLREEHIAVFQANWSDKATNLQSIAEQLSLNPDALVFVDDNPAERARVRQLFPEVAVPEPPDDPAFFVACLSAAGLFENGRLNADDLMRAGAYRENAARAEIRHQLGGYDEYLRSLEMVLTVRPFDPVGRARIAQLINKSNQFNLTTRRRTEAEVAAIETSPTHIGLQFRLADVFGDNGMICVVIVRLEAETAVIDTWLMSCRVLERGVEQAVLNEIVRELGERGVATLTGEYIPTPRNGMVSDHYPKLGFAPSGDALGEASRWQLDLADYRPFPVEIEVRR